MCLRPAALLEARETHTILAKEQLCRALIEQGTDLVTVVQVDGVISRASPAYTS
jgi:hypothetical protein